VKLRVRVSTFSEGTEFLECLFKRLGYRCLRRNNACLQKPFLLCLPLTRLRVRVMPRFRGLVQVLKLSTLVSP